jgi:hypothetical protein
LQEGSFLPDKPAISDDYDHGFIWAATQNQYQTHRSIPSAKPISFRFSSNPALQGKLSQQVMETT